MTLTYTVPGRPTTWARKRLDTRKRKPLTFTSDAQKLAMVAHQLYALVALGLHRASWSLDGAFAIGVVGYWPDAAVGDVDRLVSLAMDALEGIAYRKDRQVRELLRCAVISDGSPERVEVTVVRLERDTVQPKRRAKRAAAKRPCVRCGGTGGWAPRTNAALADCDDCGGTGAAPGAVKPRSVKRAASALTRTGWQDEIDWLRRQEEGA